MKPGRTLSKLCSLLVDVGAVGPLVGDTLLHGGRWVEGDHGAVGLLVGGPLLLGGRGIRGDRDEAVREVAQAVSEAGTTQSNEERAGLAKGQDAEEVAV